jgi:hypothetical protein
MYVAKLLFHKNFIKINDSILTNPYIIYIHTTVADSISQRKSTIETIIFFFIETIVTPIYWFFFFEIVFHLREEKK